MAHDVTRRHFALQVQTVALAEDGEAAGGRFYGRPALYAAPFPHWALDRVRPSRESTVALGRPTTTLLSHYITLHYITLHYMYRSADPPPPFIYRGGDVSRSGESCTPAFAVRKGRMGAGVVSHEALCLVVVRRSVSRRDARDARTRKGHTHARRHLIRCSSHRVIW